ncbi:MAG: hypothetical protein KatS3mg013_0495 [Actinomycetota bacterium]|nr:MAG: hypothetical protein KatS3mg013_0495 [Actinomycetota bacterium]
MTSRAARVRTSVLLGALLLAACSPGPSTGARERTIQVNGQPVPVSSLREAVTGLCAALERLPTDPMAARDAFYALSHDRLHTIAAAVQEVDRAVAASLLQSKAVVEEDLARFPFPASLAADLDRLTAATRAALGALSIRTEPC